MKNLKNNSDEKKPDQEKKEYDLDELLDQCPKEGIPLDDEDREWLFNEPVGKERFWVEIAQSKVKEAIKETERIIKILDNHLGKAEKSKTRQYLEADTPDSQIDFSGIPETDEKFWENVEIERRLRGLENGFTSNSIEGNPLTQEEKDFLTDLVKQGKTGDEIAIEIKKYLGLK